MALSTQEVLVGLASVDAETIVSQNTLFTTCTVISSHATGVAVAGTGLTDLGAIFKRARRTGVVAEITF